MLKFKGLFKSRTVAAASLPRQTRVKRVSSIDFRNMLETKIPNEALDYAVLLWEEHPFSFKITGTRSTCLGNYKYLNGHHTITVNHDLNIYNFLVTYIHEVAHQRVFISYREKRRKKTLPHGEEWKEAFRELMAPLLNEVVFPAEILKPLSAHMINPKASSTRDAALIKALKSFDSGRKMAAIHLDEIDLGQSFIFKKRTFQKLETKRTRAICLEIGTKRKYSIPLLAEISLLNDR